MASATMSHVIEGLSVARVVQSAQCSKWHHVSEMLRCVSQGLPSCSTGEHFVTPSSRFCFSLLVTLFFFP